MPIKKTFVKNRWNRHMISIGKDSLQKRNEQRERENLLDSICTTEENIHFAVYGEHSIEFSKSIRAVSSLI
jgi:hypothetical protein